MTEKICKDNAFDLYCSQYYSICPIKFTKSDVLEVEHFDQLQNFEKRF